MGNKLQLPDGSYTKSNRRFINEWCVACEAICALLGPRWRAVAYGDGMILERTSDGGGGGERLRLGSNAVCDMLAVAL